MKKRGCCSTILIVFVTVIVVAVIIGLVQSQKKDNGSSSNTSKTRELSQQSENAGSNGYVKEAEPYEDNTAKNDDNSIHTDNNNDASDNPGTMNEEPEYQNNTHSEERESEEGDNYRDVKTAEQVMFDFVSEKPGKFGDIQWCELYVVNPGDGPDEGVFGEDYIAFIVKKGTSEADTEYLFYTADRNEAVFVNSFGFGHSSLYSDPSKGDLYLVYGHMGDGEIYRLYIEGGLQMSVYKENLKYEDAGDLIEDGWIRVQGISLSSFAG